jgi:CelD/BcsL family acetyltransferase involved in cellulose biosynthesis
MLPEPKMASAGLSTNPDSPASGVPGSLRSLVAVSGLTGLCRFEGAWREVLAGAPTQRLFLQPEWAVPWYQKLGGQARGLFVFEAGRAKAAAILVAQRLGSLAAGARVLRPPGLGVSDYLDVLLPTDAVGARLAVDSLLDWLVRTRGWDLLDLPNLPSESPTARLLLAAARQRGLANVCRESYQRPFVALEGSWQSYLAGRSPKLRYNLRSRRRHLAALGDARFCHYSTPAEVDERLRAAVQVHARRWHGQRTSTKFSSSNSAFRFYVEAARRMARRGVLDLSTLEFDGRLVAFCLGFVQDRTYYYYLPAFDPEFARYGPSAALLGHLIERAYGLGLSEVDLMLGDEPYKAQWATGRRTTSRLVVAAPGVRGRAALLAFDGYLRIRERARRSGYLQDARRYGIRALLRGRT